MKGQLLSQARRCLEENATSYYPFGVKLSRSALQEYRGCEKTVKVYIVRVLLLVVQILNYSSLFFYSDPNLGLSRFEKCAANNYFQIK